VNIAFGFDIFFPETNGVMTATINLARNLVAQGHSVYFFVPRNRRYRDESLDGAIRIIHVPSIPSGIYPGVRLSNIHSSFVGNKLKEYRIDIVHETAPWLVCVALSRAAVRLGIPVIMTHHTLIDDPTYIQYGLKSRRLSLIGQRIVWKVLLNPCYRNARLITAPSKTTCADISKRVFPPREIEYISNGIDISRFLEEQPTEPLPEHIPAPYLDGCSTFVFVGRQGYEKSIHVLLQAMSKLKASHPEARLLLIGSGPAEIAMYRLANRLDLADSVFFTGAVPNKQLIGSHLLKRMAAFVTASLTENQPMTIIEALCSGCPVIVPDDPHMTSIVESEYGWIYESADVDKLAETMAYVLEHPQERNDKAANARAQLDRFDGRQVALQFEELYRQCLAR